MAGLPYVAPGPRYHTDSGLVYTENIVPAAPRRFFSRHWPIGSRANAQELSGYRHKDGAASFVDIVARCCVRHLNELGREHLEALPWEIGRKIWQQCERGDYASLRSWKLFKTCYPNEDDETLKHYKVSISNPGITLDRIAGEISSANFAFLTLLALTNITIARARLMHLPKIANLAALLIHNVKYPDFTGEPGCLMVPVQFDDTIMRAWSRCVEDGDFTRLKVVVIIDKLRNRAQVLRYLAVFPALTLCGLSKGLKNELDANKDNEEESCKTVPGWKLFDSPSMTEETHLTGIINQWMQGARTVHQTLFDIDQESSTGSHSGPPMSGNPHQGHHSTLSVSYGMNHYRISLIGQPEIVWRFRDDSPIAIPGRQRSSSMDEAVPGPKRPRVRDGMAMSLEHILNGF